MIDEQDTIFISAINQNRESMELEINGCCGIEFMVDHLNALLRFLGYQEEVSLSDEKKS